jgi:hypothetical protein
MFEIKFLMVKILQVISTLATHSMSGRKVYQILNDLFSEFGNSSEFKKYPN